MGREGSDGQKKNGKLQNIGWGGTGQKHGAWRRFGDRLTEASCQDIWGEEVLSPWEQRKDKLGQTREVALIRVKVIVQEEKT